MPVILSTSPRRQSISTPSKDLHVINGTRHHQHIITQAMFKKFVLFIYMPVNKHDAPCRDGHDADTRHCSTGQTTFNTTWEKNVSVELKLQID